MTRLFFSQVKAIKAFRNVKADLWHLHDPDLLLYGIFLTLIGKKVIWDSHEDYFLQFERGSNYRNYIPAKLRSVIFRIIRYLLNQLDRRANGIVVANETIGKAYSNNNCKVVGNEALIDQYGQSKPNFENRNILFIGPISSERCFPEVVEAIRQLENLKLIVCGSIQPEDESNLRTAQAILGERVTHSGWLNFNQLIEMYANSTIGLVVYKETAAYMDPLAHSTKLLEFFAAGLPVVGTPIPSNVKYILDSGAGLLSKGFNASDLKECILELSTSKKLWGEASQNGKIWSKAHDNWKTSERNLLEVYSIALGLSGGQA